MAKRRSEVAPRYIVRRPFIQDSARAAHGLLETPSKKVRQGETAQGDIGAGIDRAKSLRSFELLDCHVALASADEQSATMLENMNGVGKEMRRLLRPIHGWFEA